MKPDGYEKQEIYPIYNYPPQIQRPAPPQKRGRGKGIRVAIGALAISIGIGTALGTAYQMGRQNFFAQPLPTYVNTAAADPVDDISANISTLSAQNTMTVAEVFRATRDAVVSINMTAQVTTMFNRVSNVSGAGSGIIFHEDDEKIYIVTNYHVIDSATEVTISLDDETAAQANLVGSDEESDIAVISVRKSALEEAGITGYKIATFAAADSSQVGDTAIAIGNAAGEGKSATRGIISAVNKRININGISLEVLQTDAAINPGNSGGPLMNDRGQVVGINTAKLSETGVEGMGYAIPSGVVGEIIDQIMKDGSVKRPYLGLYAATITEQHQRHYGFSTRGVYVNAVEAGTTAEAAGLRQGDIIIRYNGIIVTGTDQLAVLEAETAVGESVTIVVVRDNQTEVTLRTTMQAYVSSTNF